MPSSLNPEFVAELGAALRAGAIVPCLGPGVLADVRDLASGAAMPADSDSLILAMNGGRPMAPKLMYEFSRAAMNLELKRGRAFVTRFLNRVYGETVWSRAAAHDWLAALRPPYVIDLNRDTQLQEAYADQPHQLVTGVARLGGPAQRYRLYRWQEGEYRESESLTPDLPILFKPLGTPRPQGCYIASDADYVDYLTELMGGFAVPPTLKTLRRGKRYLLLGLRLNRDTERMLVADLIDGAAPDAGWALIREPSARERSFCARHGLALIEADVEDWLAATGVGAVADSLR